MNSAPKNREYCLGELINAKSHLERKRLLLEKTDVLVNREAIDALAEFIKDEKDNDAILRLTAALQTLIRALRDGVQAAIAWDRRADLLFSAMASQSGDSLRQTLARDWPTFTDELMDEVVEENMARYRNQPTIMERFRVVQAVAREMAGAKKSAALPRWLR